MSNKYNKPKKINIAPTKKLFGKGSAKIENSPPIIKTIETPFCVFLSLNGHITSFSSFILFILLSYFLMFSLCVFMIFCLLSKTFCDNYSEFLSQNRLYGQNLAFFTR